MKYVLVLLAASVFAQSIHAPRVGVMLCHDGSLREVTGIAGSFTLGDEVAPDAAPAPAYTVEHRGDAAYIINALGGVVDVLPQATGPVLLPGDGTTVYIAGDELVLRRVDHSETRYPVSGVSVLRSMSPDYVQAGGHALRLSTGALYLLPQPASPLTDSQGRRR